MPSGAVGHSDRIIRKHVEAIIIIKGELRCIRRQENNAGVAQIVDRDIRRGNDLNVLAVRIRGFFPGCREQRGNYAILAGTVSLL